MIISNVMHNTIEIVYNCWSEPLYVALLVNLMTIISPHLLPIYNRLFTSRRVGEVISPHLLPIYNRLFTSRCVGEVISLHLLPIYNRLFTSRRVGEIRSSHLLPIFYRRTMHGATNIKNKME